MTSKIPPLIKTVDPYATQQSESRMSFMSGGRKRQSGDMESEIFKDYTYINKLVGQLNSIMQNEDMILSTRFENLEDEIAKSRQAIIDLRGRIDRIHHLPDLSNKPSARARMDSNANAAVSELTVGTTVEYLRNKPMILTNFTEQNPPDEMIDILHRLPDDVKDRFLGYSIVQLDRLVKCIRCYRTLSQSVGSDDFSRHLIETLEELFCSNSVFLFLCDPKTGEFYTKFDHKSVTVSLKKGESVVTSVSKAGNVAIYTDPTKAPCYSVSLDPLFNPENLPVLLIPIEGDAVIMVLCTDKESFMFSTEDQVVAAFFSLLLGPLLKDHLRCEDQVKDRELRKLVQSFERDIFSKEKFDQLLPFLNDSFMRYGKATDMRIFILKDGFLMSYDIENGRLVESKHDVIGVPAWVIRTMLHISVDCLSFAETECFDYRIDGWAEGKPFAAFPILESSERAMAVLCLTRDEKFNHWDFEFFTSVSTTLSLAIPKCLESANTISNDEANASVENLPSVIAKFPFETIESETAVSQIARIISEQTKAEIISVYLRETSTNATKRLVTLRNQELVDEDVVSDGFVDFVFSKDEPINATDPKRVEKFETRNNSLVVRSVMCVVNRTHEDNHIAVIELNSTSSSGQFGAAYHDCVISFSSMILFSLKVHHQNEVIGEAKKAAVIMELVYKYWSESIRESSAPMETIMEMGARLFDASFSAMLRFSPLSGGFVSFMHSTKSPSSVIPREDPLLARICGTEDVQLIENLRSITESELMKLYEVPASLLSILVNKQQKVYALFVVDKLTHDYLTRVKYLRPVLSTIYRNWCYSEVKVQRDNRKEISDMVNIFDANVLASDVVSRIFSVTEYDESQKIEILITMFDKFDLLSILQTDYEGLMEFLLTVRSNYNNNLPYHNWDHAIDTTQFVYSCLMRGKMNRFFKPAHLAAILLAALLHDVDHKGVNSTFLINSHSPLVSAYGEESPMEKHHLAIAMKLLRDHLITKEKELYKDITFWQFFSSCILSTDMIKHFDYMDKFKPLTLGFNPTNPKEPHLLLIAQMIVKCGNFANCTRPFDVAKSMAENLVKEYEAQGRKEEELELQLSGISEAVIMRKQSVAEIELEFLTAVVSPLLKLLGGIIPELADWSIQMEDNKKQWDEVRS